MGPESAKEIVKKAPYSGLKDLAYKTDFSIVDQDVIRCLVEGGFFDDEFKGYNKSSEKKNRLKWDDFVEYIVEKFAKLRKDAKASGKEGVGPESLL
jgi:hypothetical protein